MRQQPVTKDVAAKSPDLVVLSREDAEFYEPGPNEICISISDPEAPPADVSPRFAAVLRLHFDDVTERGVDSDILFAADQHALSSTLSMSGQTPID